MAEVQQKKQHLMKRCNFMVSDYQIERLREISKDTTASMSELVREGITMVIKEYSNVIRKEA